jgi:hypothetical protein
MKFSPAKPIIDAEPNYEDGPIGFNPANGRFSDLNGAMLLTGLYLPVVLE